MNNCSISWKKDLIEKAEDKVIHQHVLLLQKKKKQINSDIVKGL